MKDQAHPATNEESIHIRKNPDDATMKPVECGEIGVRSITEAWGYYGPAGEGHAEVCRACIAARAVRRGDSRRGAP